MRAGTMTKYLWHVFVVLCCICGSSNSSHQRWWKKHTCQCTLETVGSTEKPVHEIVKTMFPGLLLNSNELSKLPIIKPAGTRRHRETSYVGNIIPSQGSVKDSCCQTEFSYEIINDTVSNNRNLKVVHFNDAYQFVPTGKCPENSTCGRGSCIQMYRHQWLLIWDHNLPHYPPVTFAAVEVPSHCECVNIGT